MRNVSDKSCREKQNTHFVFSNLFSENRSIYERMWQNTGEPDTPQMSMQYDARAWHAGYLRLQTHTHNM